MAKMCYGGADAGQSSQALAPLLEGAIKGVMSFDATLFVNICSLDQLVTKTEILNTKCEPKLLLLLFQLNSKREENV